MSVNLVNEIDKIKTKLTDGEYLELMNECKKIYDKNRKTGYEEFWYNEYKKVVEKCRDGCCHNNNISKYNLKCMTHSRDWYKREYYKLKDSKSKSESDDKPKNKKRKIKK